MGTEANTSNKADGAGSIRIACDVKDFLELEDFRELQGDLKDLDPEDARKLRAEILTTGFAFPIHVWRERVLNGPEKGVRNWIVGGHQRVRVLRAMKAEGMRIPRIPVVYVHADDIDGAKRRVIQDVAQYARVNPQGMYDFMQGAKLDLAHLQSGFRIPDFDMQQFQLQFYPQKRHVEFDTNGDPIPPPVPPAVVKLADRFLVPPFSVLDARQGYWQLRKRAWIALGIQSELGRGENLLQRSDSDSDREWMTDKTAFQKKKQTLGAVAGNMEKKKKRDALSPNILDRERAARNHVNGVLMNSDSGNDPKYYLKKQEAERRLGRTLTTAEFQQDHYDGPDSYESGTSIFDPVLCELAYLWFCPPGGKVLDPFAGGSVRGVVAGMLGREYTGVDLIENQVRENRRQAEEIFARAAAALVVGVDLAKPGSDRTVTHVVRKKTVLRQEGSGLDEVKQVSEDLKYISDPKELTPVVEVEGYWVKRDDLFAINGIRGGKVRCALAAAEGAKGLTTAGAKQSPQGAILAAVAKHLGIPSTFHCPSGAWTPQMLRAKELGAEIAQHVFGRNNVVAARARADAEERGFTYVPFGMETPHMVQATRRQAENLVGLKFKRLVLCVGQGMSLSGILCGLKDYGIATDVLGVCVGSTEKVIRDRLGEYAPKDWEQYTKLVRSELEYTDLVVEFRLGEIDLDRMYEAKCLAFLKPGDLFWVIGVRP